MGRFRNPSRITYYYDFLFEPRQNPRESAM
jgi:hypothetical protein